MKRETIKEVLTSLALSTGRYGRILQAIYEMPEDEREEFWEHLESQHFGDALDLVMFFEC